MPTAALARNNSTRNGGGVYSGTSVKPNVAALLEFSYLKMSRERIYKS